MREFLVALNAGFTSIIEKGLSAKTIKIKKIKINGVYSGFDRVAVRPLFPGRILLFGIVGYCGGRKS